MRVIYIGNASKCSDIRRLYKDAEFTALSAQSLPQSYMGRPTADIALIDEQPDNIDIQLLEACKAGRIATMVFWVYRM